MVFLNKTTERKTNVDQSWSLKIFWEQISNLIKKPIDVSQNITNCKNVVLNSLKLLVDEDENKSGGKTSFLK